ncbi:histidine kinase [Brevibacillus choshinensis]|uniref:histidine kinase n=1 Tax=Brevibacillus choshinensis TaxID=54911 RepID=A0ABR5N872_BRECH|nr:ATP-binding protein [Brevibacillus choshinensis]KQL46808.1 histidine kinase [Brevibacillus choshinensis]
MSENNIISRQQMTFVIYNFIAFTLIFSIFGLIIFSQMKLTLYSKTDVDLFTFKRNIEQQGLPPLQQKRAFGPPENRQPGPGPMPFMPNPRITILTWNQSGEIINSEGNTGYYDDLFTDLALTKSDLPSTIMIDGQYHFRTLTLPDPNPQDEIATIQLLVNVDGEQNVIHNFQTLLILCSILFILLSLAASFILSRKTMKPIIRSWNKQVEFVENASHELRTPLTIIQNKVELLLTTPYEKIMDKFEHIALILSETRRLSKLTTDLLTLARADSSETQLIKQPIEVDPFVQQVCEPYIELADSQSKHLWVETQSDATMQADKSRIHQLMVILLDNAIKYTGKNDSILVKTVSDDHSVTLEISDTGIGISEEGLQQIFDRFYREDKARSREKGGAGLGLSIAQWIVTSHHGTIKALHNQPKGTIIRIKLPI